MPSTITLNKTVTWASSFVDFMQLNIGSGNEPAITNANTVLQTILGAPFKWNWNRNTPPPLNFTTTAGVQDYDTFVGDYGFLEAASLTDPGNKTYAIKEVKQELTSGSELGRPQSIAAQLDDNTGNITFRLLPVPDLIYQVFPYYQKKPSLITSLGNTWTPIPDHFSYIYNYGFLALSMAYSEDARFPIFNQKFVAHLLGAQQGLSETERNMFLDTWNLIANQQSVAGLKQQQGRAALGT